ncbi:hypothetical protein BAE44_0020845 [Dichanthelium oligosanthes]|uniref:UspA domain-containing protein n=1 Tax=Dichanthelium oligosanthes TaxID=888268 RepID=A0A1E5UZ06_9POAL|nr:hypothetical protein BAE44_0020845 [Dichanthelium oligosanthes]
MASSAGDRFLRQLSASNGGGDGGCGLQDQQQEYGGVGRRGSRRWSKKRAAARGYGAGSGYGGAKQQGEARKRVMVVVDESSGAKHAMMWALTHVANKGDFLTLLHVLPHSGSGRGEEASSLANSLGTLCKASRPEVHISTCICICILRSSSEEFVEQCINQAECLTLAVRKQSKGMGGYLISTRWQKNFWLLA